MSMKDLLNKMSQLEALPAPKTRQVLNESSPAPVATTTKRSLKDVFNELHEAIPAGAKPLPVMDPQNKQAGAGFLTSKDSTIQGMLSKLGPNDVQIVQAPGQTQPGQQQSNQQQSQQKSLQPMQASNQPNQTMQEEEFDEANTGDEAEEKFNKYNAKELDYMLDRAAFKSKPGDAHKQNRARQAKDAAYNLMIRKKYPYVAQPSDENLEEVSDELKARYTRGAAADLDDVSYRLRSGQDGDNRFIKPGGKTEKEFKRIANNRTVGLQRAKPEVQDQNGDLKEGAKVDRMVKHIEKSEKKSGKSKDEAENIAWATANKRGMLDNKNKKKVKEADLPSSSSDRGAGLGAGRSKLRLEAKEPQVEVIDNAFNRENYKDLIGKKYPKSKAPAYARVKELSEGKKPDFLDLDKDGNRKEPMKKAAVDKKKKAVNEAAGDTSDIGYELLDMAEEIKELARNAMRLVSGTAEEGRASSYWYPHIIMAVSEDHSYLGKSMFTMVDSAQRLIDGGDDEDDDFYTTTSESKKTKKKKVDESMNHGIQAARLEGKSHGLKGHAYAGKHADMEEARAYHEGYKEGLDELHGMDIRQAPVVSFLKREARMPATTRGMARRSLEDTPLDEMIDEADSSGGYQAVPSKGNYMGDKYDVVDSSGRIVMMGQSKAEAEASARFKNAGRPPVRHEMADDMEEGNAFTGALARTPKGGKFSVGGKSFIDRSSYDSKLGEGDFAFEAWDRKLNSLIKEGFSVSISKGESNSPDSVNVNATDAEADKLLSLVKQAGMGIFGGDEGSDYGSPEVGGRSEINSPGGIEVVDDHDGMLGLMKKLSGIDGPNADYEEEEEDCGCDDEEENVSEARCDECGMMESKCGGHDEALDEVESEDQMEFGVAEANAPDSGAANATNDTQGNAAANQALAKADAGQDIEDGMKDQAVEEALEPWMDKDAAEDGKVPAFMRKERWEKNMADEIGPPSLRSVKDEEPEEKENDVKESFTDLYKKLAMLSEESTAEKDEKAEKAGKKVTKDIEYDDKKDKKEKVDEWANQIGKGPGKGTDASFEQDIDFMTKVISGGLNKPKSTGQTTVPVVASQLNRLTSHDTTDINESVSDWKKLAGIN